MLKQKCTEHFFIAKLRKKNSEKFLDMKIKKKGFRIPLHRENRGNVLKIILKQDNLKKN